jgi:hypothetical protein
MDQDYVKVMAIKEVPISELPDGLYRIHWDDDSVSQAAVGSNHAGKRWFAPTNWINVPSYDWKMINYVETVSPLP